MINKEITDVLEQELVIPGLDDIPNCLVLIEEPRPLTPLLALVAIPGMLLISRVYIDHSLIPNILEADYIPRIPRGSQVAQRGYGGQGTADRVRGARRQILWAQSKEFQDFQ